MAEDIEIDIDDLERRMKGAMDSLRHEFGSLRTGRSTAISGSRAPPCTISDVSTCASRQASSAS